MPIRPTVRRCPAPAMPATSVAKISGAMIILIIRRNSWLNGPDVPGPLGVRVADDRAYDDPEDQANQDLLGE